VHGKKEAVQAIYIILYLILVSMPLEKKKKTLYL